MGYHGQVDYYLPLADQLHRSSIDRRELAVHFAAG